MEEVGAWIHNESKPHGFVMKAMVEAPSEAAGDADMSMQCEALYNNSSASYAPKLIVSWTGELTELDRLAMDEYDRENNMTKETDVLGNS